MENKIEKNIYTKKKILIKINIINVMNLYFLIILIILLIKI